MRFLFNEGGIGDAVLMSAVAENGGHCLVSSKYNDLLKENPNITTRSLPAREVFLTPNIYETLIRRGQEPFYVHYWDLEQKNKDIFLWRYPKIHMIAKACARAGVFGTIRAAPKIYLRDEELEQGAPVEGPYLVMQSTGAQWKTAGYHTWARVARLLRKDFTIVQVGAPSDKPLPFAKNLCGLLSLRQVAAVICKARAFLGLMGGLMHIARAVGTRAVISFSDSEPLYFSGYIANEHAESGERCNLCRNNVINILNGDICPKNYICCTSITPESILLSFDKLYTRLEIPLEIETINNESEKEKINARILYYMTYLRAVGPGFRKIEA